MFERATTRTRPNRRALRQVEQAGLITADQSVADIAASQIGRQVRALSD